jgi:Armadillo/beta-catenin-like repeat
VHTCRNNGIPRLATLLRAEDTTVASSAAGTLQNVAREVASRMVVADLDCTADFARLLASRDAHAQVCAAGALLNVLGPAVSARGEGQRRGMCRIMALVMSLASIHDSCFGAPAALAARLDARA